MDVAHEPKAVQGSNRWFSWFKITICHQSTSLLHWDPAWIAFRGSHQIIKSYGNNSGILINDLVDGPKHLKDGLVGAL